MTLHIDLGGGDHKFLIMLYVQSFPSKGSSGVGPSRLVKPLRPSQAYF